MLSDKFIATLRSVVAQNKKLLERVPEDKFTWKPHERSTSLGRLAMHIAELPDWITRYMESDAFDFAAQPFKAVMPETHADIMEQHRISEEKAVAALSTKPDAFFDTGWQLKRGEHVISAVSRSEHIEKLFYHITHHRGQLTVYLRLLDVPLPNLFGPTADER